MTVDAIGWLASLVLLATLIHQIVKQWNNPSPESAPLWLFLGQASASALFIVYSVMVGNWVFIVTNSLLLLTALAGQWVARRAMKRGDKQG